MNSADCYFLDINLGSEITGMDLAKQIRSIDPLASIIFVTSHNEMLQLTFTYHVEALDFIIKNEIINLQDNILSALKNAYQKYRKIGTHPNMQYYPLKIGEYIKNIELDSILFFQASSIAHKITVHTIQGEFEYYDTLNTIEDSNKDFFRIHRSFVVNIKNISKLDMKQRQVIMKNGIVCPVSFRRLKLLEKAIRDI